MTEPTTPPNPQPPHAATHTEPQSQSQPVVVQAQAPDTGMVNQLNAMAKTLAGLPEQIVNSFREATQPGQMPAQQPAQQTQPNVHAGGSGAQPPGSTTGQQPTVQTTRGPRQTKVARWFFGVKNDG